jgi:hypothetical protein
MYRNSKLLEKLREAPICFGCGKWNPEGNLVVAAHSNHLLHGKGRGIKADDCYVAALCNDCHGAIDQGSKLSDTERTLLWHEACVLTYGWLIKDGHLKLK